MTDASGTTTFTYDDLDRLISKATPQGTLTYTYDGNSNVESMQSSNANGASVTYGYDPLNRLVSVTDNRLSAGQNTTTYSYDPASNLVTAIYSNGQTRMLTYDTLNRLSQSNTASSSYGYSRAATGQMLSLTEGSGRGASYTYDNVWRLANETVFGDPGGRNGALGYSLDSVSNRLSLNSTLSGIAPQTFTFNANDQTNGETYDADGNLLTSGANSYAWDFANHLKSFNGSVTLVYDGDGNRVAKTVSGTTTRFLVDDLNPTGYPQVVEELSSGTVQRVYTYGLQRISQLQMLNSTWTPSWYLTDGEGHVRALTNAAGSITDTYDYDAFGNRLNSTGTTPNIYLYRAEQWDPDLGLYYLRARWYNPVTGRFLSRDPLDAGNKYAYAFADPVNRSDPSGKDSVLTRVKTFTIGIYPFVAAYTAKQIAVDIATGIVIGTFSAVGADFICVMKAATDLGLAANGISSYYFDQDLRYYGYHYSCAATKPILSPEPDPEPPPDPTPVPNSPPIPPIQPPARRPPSNCDTSIEQYHHYLPFAFAPWFAAPGRGINVNDPSIMVCMPINEHQRLHSPNGGNWNGRWEQFMQRLPNASQQQVYDFLNSLLDELRPYFPNL